MSEDIRRDTGPIDDVDQRERYADPAAVDERIDRRDSDPTYADERMDRRDSDPSHVDDRVGRRDDDEEYAADRLDEATGHREAAMRTGDGIDAGHGGTDRDTHRDPSSERHATAGPGTTTSWSDEGLLGSDDRSAYQQRWDEIQVRFIDEPRQCVREADDLVGEVTTRISKRFSNARADMEQRWDGGDEPTTEELRQAVQRYRDFFQRLVAQ